MKKMIMMLSIFHICFLQSNSDPKVFTYIYSEITNSSDNNKELSAKEDPQLRDNDNALKFYKNYMKDAADYFKGVFVFISYIHQFFIIPYDDKYNFYNFSFSDSAKFDSIQNTDVHTITVKLENQFIPSKIEMPSDEYFGKSIFSLSKYEKTLKDDFIEYTQTLQHIDNFLKSKKPTLNDLKNMADNLVEIANDWYKNNI